MNNSHIAKLQVGDSLAVQIGKTWMPAIVTSTQVVILKVRKPGSRFGETVDVAKPVALYEGATDWAKTVLSNLASGEVDEYSAQYIVKL